MPIGSFTASDKMVKTVLRSDGTLYSIPRYQRGYAWKRSQYETLWNDIIEQLDKLDTGLFIGTVLLNHGEHEHSRVEVIDGQQRLLTLTILLSSIRDSLHELQQYDFASQIHRNYIADSEYAGEEQIPKIIPGDKLQSYFRIMVQDYPKVTTLDDLDAKTDEEKNVKNCKNFYDNKVKQMVKKIPKSEMSQKIATLVSLTKCIEKITVVTINVDHEEDAYTVFESVNAKGTALTLADILKNMIFRRLKPETTEDDFAQNQWDKILKNLDSTNFSMSKFIRYHWLSKYEFLTESKLYSAIKQKLDRDKTLTWAEFLDDLVADSLLIKNLINPEIADFPSIKSPRRVVNSLNAISSMGVSQCYVLLLSMNRNLYMKKRWERDIEFLENFCFNYHTVGKLQAVRVEKKYSDYARKIENINSSSEEDKSGILEEELKKMIQELSNLKNEFVTQEHFQNQFISNIQYSKNKAKRHLLGYVLLKINNHMAGGTGELKVDPLMTNIEHIMPQKPEQWGYEPEDVSDFINEIGNLTLLSKKLNSKGGARVMEYKKPLLAESELAITKNLLHYISNNEDIWDETIIKNRSKILADICYTSIWKI